MRQANEIAAELMMIESRSKGELMKEAAAVIMGQSHLIGELRGQCVKLQEEAERCRKALPAGHPCNDHERLSRAADYLSGYCAMRKCDGCPLAVACRGTGMPLPKLLDCMAEVVEKPALVAEFSSKR